MYLSNGNVLQLFRYFLSFYDFEGYSAKSLFHLLFLTVLNTNYGTLENYTIGVHVQNGKMTSYVFEFYDRLAFYFIWDDFGHEDKLKKHWHFALKSLYLGVLDSCCL